MINKNDPRLTAYLLDELDAEQAGLVESAIDESPELQEHVKGLRNTIGVLNRVCSVDQDSGESLSPEQLSKVESAASSPNVAADDEDDGWSTRIRWRNFAIAALILYAAGISIFAFSKPTPIATLNGQTSGQSIPASSNGLDIGGGRLRTPEESTEASGFENNAPNRPALNNPVSSEPDDGDGYADVPSEPAIAYPDADVWEGMSRRRIDVVGNAGVAEAEVAELDSLDFAETEPDSDPFGGLGLSDGPSPAGDTVVPDFAMRTDGENRLRSEVRAQLRFAESNLRRDPTGVPERLKALLDQVESADNVEPRLRREFQTQLRSAIESSRSREAQHIEDSANIELRTEAASNRESLSDEGRARGGRGFGDGDPGEVENANSAKVDDLLSMLEEAPESSETESSNNLAPGTGMADPRPPSAPATAEDDDSISDPSSSGEGQTDGQETASAENTSNRIAAAGSRNARFDRAIKEAEQRLAKERAKQKAKTWKPAAATANRARLSVGHQDDLELAARDTYVRIDGFRARVFFDLYYYNDRPQQLEGQFLLRLPSDASLHYFAFGATPVPTPDAPPATGKPGERKPQMPAAVGAVRSLREQTAATGFDLARRASDPEFTAEKDTLFGAVKAARVVPRQKAALAYEETVRRRVDPALVEWAGPGIFQTKVFPLLPNQLHRVVVGYDVMLREDGSDQLFEFKLPAGEAGGRVEFDIAASGGTAATLAPETNPFVSGGRAYYRFVDAAPRDYSVRISGAESAVLTSPESNDPYFATRMIANLPDAAAKNDSSRAVLLLDTSWSDRPAAFSRRLKLLQHVLEQNRDSITEFAVLLFNVEQRWWREEYAANTPANVSKFLRDANQLVLEGATDLHGALTEATNPSWQERTAESGGQANYFLFSDAAATWGRTDLASLSDPLTQLDRSAGGGALFGYHLAGHSSDRSTLQWLADASGGAVFDVGEEAELENVAIAHRSRPWKIVKATAPGADEILIRGASKTVYPNQPLVIAGRGELRGPLQIVLKRGKEKRSLNFKPKLKIASPLAARLYGQLAVDRLEPYSGELEKVTIAMARYFRVPGRTCSLVMLETAEDYERFGVNVSPEEDQLVVASTSVTDVIKEQESRLRDRRQNPRKQFLAWVDSLQSASLLNVSTALRLAVERLPESAFSFDAKPLNCQAWKVGQLKDVYLQELRQDAPGFDAVLKEADRRRSQFSADDAIKTASTLVEAKPSDADTLRSVAFRAIQWKRSDQAAPLLWRLARARPYQPQCLLLLARAAAESGDVDSAAVAYDLVSTGNWNQRWGGTKQIAEMELLNLLEKIDSGEATSAFPRYARARLQQLRRRWCDEGMDLVVIMHWNTDRTDVDLHVTDPSGEECFYSHSETKAGGKMTQDITDGLGPEMFTLETAPAGEYKVEAKYYRADQNRTKARTETLVTVMRNFGRTSATSTTKRITSDGAGEKQLVFKTNVKH